MLPSSQCRCLAGEDGVQPPSPPVLGLWCPHQPHTCQPPYPDSQGRDRLKFCCRCSMLEIYNEVITDLLNPSATNLQVRVAGGASSAGSHLCGPCNFQAIPRPRPLPDPRGHQARLLCGGAVRGDRAERCASGGKEPGWGVPRGQPISSGKAEGQPWQVSVSDRSSPQNLVAPSIVPPPLVSPPAPRS